MPARTVMRRTERLVTDPDKDGDDGEDGVGGSPMPTMEAVAKAVGVSSMTVSRAFRGASSIRPQTRARILAAAERLGYFPNLAASELASQQSRSIGVVVPTLQDSIYADMLETMHDVLKRHGHDYVLQTINYRREREPAALQALLSRRVKAILLPSIGHSPRARAIIERLPVPHVEFGSLSPDNIGAAVGHSDYEAGRMATAHLLARGRRRIALICGPTGVTSHARDRLRGYVDALAEAGCPWDARLVEEIDHAVPPAAAAFVRLLELEPGIDGLVIGGEIWQAVVMLEAARHAVRIPDALSIIGIGEVELVAYTPIPLTTIALPRRETGRLAAEMILDLSAGRPPSPAVVTLPLRLVARASV